MKKRYSFMDVIRLVAMLGIVYYHMVAELYLTGIRQLESVTPLVRNSNMHIAKICVGLFFMISGAGLVSSTLDADHLDLKKYYFKRFTKILIPFYLVYLLWLVVFMLLTGSGFADVYTNDAQPWTIIFTLLGMDAYINSFSFPTFSLGIGEWFLGALVLMYLVFPFLRWALKKNKWITLSGMSVYYIIILATYKFMPFAETNPGYVNFTVKIMEFFLGMFLITVIDKIPRWVYFAFSVPIIVFFALFPTTVSINENLVVLIINLAFFALFAGLEGVFKKIPRVIKIISFLAGYSYVFFLIHHVVIQYMTLQHAGVPFGNLDVLILFVEEFLVVAALTVLVNGILKFPKLLSGKKNGKETSEPVLESPKEELKENNND